MTIAKEVQNKRAIKAFKGLEKQFTEVHKGKYKYDKSVYVSTMTKIVITCPKHGDFLQTPSKHKSGQGCPKCKADKAAKAKSISTTEFIEKAIGVHKNKYDYSKTLYTGAYEDVVIGCKIHGEFTQRASAHLQGRNCPKCASTMRAASNTKTQEQFIMEATKAHKGIYTYKNTKYIRAQDHIHVTCKIHGDFSIQAQSHLQGFGCPSCSTGGFNPGKEAILYYLKLNGGQAYKIGITNKSIKERFSNSELELIEIEGTWFFSKGVEAKAYESNILKKYSEYQWDGVPLLVSGNTELFTKDVRTATSQCLFESFDIQKELHDV